MRWFYCQCFVGFFLVALYFHRCLTTNFPKCKQCLSVSVAFSAFPHSAMRNKWPEIRFHLNVCDAWRLAHHRCRLGCHHMRITTFCMITSDFNVPEMLHLMSNTTCMHIKYKHSDGLLTVYFSLLEIVFIVFQPRIRYIAQWWMYSTRNENKTFLRWIIFVQVHFISLHFIDQIEEFKRAICKLKWNGFLLSLRFESMDNDPINKHMLQTRAHPISFFFSLNDNVIAL